jgi:hypothetical protein
VAVGLIGLLAAVAVALNILCCTASCQQLLSVLVAVRFVGFSGSCAGIMYGNVISSCGQEVVVVAVASSACDGVSRAYLLQRRHVRKVVHK